MGMLEDLADRLAQDVIDAMDETGDENLVETISKVLISTSSTTQEAFMTQVKIRLSERRARRVLDDKLAAFRAAAKK